MQEIIDSAATAAHMENLMESKAHHRFPTIAGISQRLIPSGLDNCFAVTHTLNNTTATTIFNKKITKNRGRKINFRALGENTDDE